MAEIPFLERAVAFRTDLGAVVRAVRPYVPIEFIDGAGNVFHWLAMIDSGAPFSVLPYTLWHEHNIIYNLLGSQLLRGDKLDAAALTWQGVPCRLAETPIRLVDQRANARSRPLLLTAKLVLAPISSSLEKEAILGDSFLVDNSLALSMRGIADKLKGTFTVED
jgi:hypothetical protein